MTTRDEIKARIEQDGIEFLLAQPASRREVWLGKILAYLTYLIALNVVVGSVGLISIGLLLLSGGTAHRTLGAGIRRTPG